MSQEETPRDRVARLLEESLDRIEQLAQGAAWAAGAVSAEDLASEAVLRVWEEVRAGRVDFASRGEFLAWMTTVLRNLAIEERRKAVRVRSIVPGDASEPGPLDEVQAYELAAREAAARKLVKEEIDHLPEKYAIVLRMYFEEIPPHKIASVLGITPENARVRKHRALAMLEERVEKRLLGKSSSPTTRSPRKKKSGKTRRHRGQ